MNNYNFLLFLICTFGILSCNNTPNQEPTSPQTPIPDETPPEEPIQAEDSRAIYTMGMNKELLSEFPESVYNRLQRYEQVLADKNGDAIYIQQDFNGDAIQDLALVTSGNDDMLKLVVFSSSNQKSWMEIDSTGGLIVPFKEEGQDRNILTHKNNVIQLYLPSMRAEMWLKFRYEKDKKDYFLIGKDNVYYGNGYSNRSSINYLTGKRIHSQDGVNEERNQPEKTETIQVETPRLSTLNEDNQFNDIPE